MNILFYLAGAIAVYAAVRVVTLPRAMYALIHLVLLFIAIATVFFTLGAPFLAALQIIIYAGAILVLFVFVVMMLDLDHPGVERERQRLSGGVWALPAALAAVLLALLVAVLARPGVSPTIATVSPQAVGRSLYRDYAVGVELASLLLVAALVAAYRFGVLRRRLEEPDEQHSAEPRPDSSGDPLRVGSGGGAGAAQSGVHPDVH